MQDEVQGWDQQNKGWKLADTQYRSLAGMGGRFLQICNAWDPAEESVAQRTWEKGTNVFKMKTESGPGSIRSKRDRKRMLRRVYVGSGHVDLERIEDEIVDYLKRGEIATAERYFLNRIVPEEDQAFDVVRWHELVRPDYQPANGSKITIGVDGARFRDDLAIVAAEIETGFVWPLHVFTRPKNAPEDYEHDFEEADGVVRDAFEQYNVRRVYVDPGSQYANITPLMERWQGRWGKKRVYEWLMARPTPTCYMIRNFASAIQTGDLSHDGNDVLTRAVANSRRRESNVLDDDKRKMHTIQKEHPRSEKKIDAAAAAALSWEARGDEIATKIKGPLDERVKRGSPSECAQCGHPRRHHSDLGCRWKPEGHCRQFVEESVELIGATASA